MTDREKEKKHRETTKTESDQKSARGRPGRYLATNVTAATVPKPGVTSSRPAFEEKREKERERQKKRERQKYRDI